MRDRKLLVGRKQIDKLSGKVDRSGYTLVPINLHYIGGRIKCEIGLAKGKKQHDKRDTERERDGRREVAQAMKTNQPSKSCKKPSAIDCPQYSTVTPITPIRKLFIRTVMGIVERNITARFQNAALKK